MLSMTGFGVNKSKLTSGELVVQVKSVNSRFLDLKIHIPREYSLWEKEVRDIVKKNISRGTVEVYCARKFKNNTSRTTINSDIELGRKWLKEYKKLSKGLKLNNSEDPSLIEILKSVPVLSTGENKDVNPAEKKAFFKSLDMAIKGCLGERKREGMALKKSFNGALMSLSKELNSIEKNRKKANDEILKRWKSKLDRFKNEKNLDSGRLAQEASVLIEKSDINEEVIRLKEHISNCKKLLSAKGRLGKKLEFYSQELLREINTIGSKSQIVELTSSVVNAKTIIEQIREQVQNIE